MFRRASQSISALTLAALAPACVKHLPPAPTPAADPPAVQLPPPVEGQGVVVVDVTDGPTPVQRVVMAARPEQDAKGRTIYRFFEQPGVLCAMSPCASFIPHGNVLLGFPVIGKDDLEVELVHVGTEPTVYRRTLSVYEDKTGGLRVFGIVMTAVGGTAIATGTALLPIGLAEDSRGLTIAGAASLGLGAAMLVFGILAMKKDAPTFRPGASNHFPLAR